MTVFLGGPATTDLEDTLLADISGRVFRMQSYGQPALVKLLNNALGTYSLAATARMLNLADREPTTDTLNTPRCWWTIMA